MKTLNKLNLLILRIGTNMLIVNKWTNKHTQKTFIMAHEFKHNKLLKSYAKCDESMLELFCQQHKNIYVVSVSRETDLSIKVI